MLRAQRTKCEDHWKEYKNRKAGNETTKMCRITELNYWKGRLESASNSKQCWGAVNEMQGKRKCNKIGQLKGENGDILVDNAQKADSLNEFFTTIGPRLANNIEPVNFHPFEHLFRVTPTVSLPHSNDNMIEEKNSAELNQEKVVVQMSLLHQS